MLPLCGARGGVLKAPKIDYVDAFRLKRAWLTKLSLVAVLLIIAFLVVAEVDKAGEADRIHARRRLVRACAREGRQWRTDRQELPRVSRSVARRFGRQLHRMSRQAAARRAADRRAGMCGLPFRASRCRQARCFGRRDLLDVPSRPARARQESGSGEGEGFTRASPASAGSIPTFRRAAIPTRCVSITRCISRPAASSTVKGGAKNCNAFNATSSSRRKGRLIRSLSSSATPASVATSSPSTRAFPTSKCRTAAIRDWSMDSSSQPTRAIATSSERSRRDPPHPHVAAAGRSRRARRPQCRAGHQDEVQQVPHHRACRNAHRRKAA